MNPNDPIAWWYSRVDFERRSPTAGDLKLDQMRALLSALDEPQRHLRIIHVTGTKGKGSTSAILANILQQAGYRTGLFTSPHLSRVEERIQINREPISSPELAALVGEIRDRLPPHVSPTFFEVATAAGWLYFWRRRVDIAVVEVGLGGRFDSTNVCWPMLSIITSISYDHTQILGSTLASIAFEKAGIIKPGRPVISGVTNEEAQPVIERIARERGSRLRQLDRDFHVGYQPASPERPWPQVTVQTEKRLWPTMALGLLGRHQACNAALAIAAVEELQRLGLTLSDSQVATGLQTVVWPARLEILARQPLVLLDCSHNVASVEALVATLAEMPIRGRRWLIFASSADKDIPGMLRVLAPHVDHAVLTRYAHSVRAADPDQLARWAGEVGMKVSRVFPTAAPSWEFCLHHAKAEDMILIAGSVFLAGELRPIIVRELHEVHGHPG